MNLRAFGDILQKCLKTNKPLASHVLDIMGVSGGTTHPASNYNEEQNSPCQMEVSFAAVNNAEVGTAQSNNGGLDSLLERTSLTSFDNDYSICTGSEKILGTGFNGDVVRAIEKASGIVRAVKVLYDSPEARTEISCQYQCAYGGNDVIVPIVDVYLENAAGCSVVPESLTNVANTGVVLVVVMELLDGGELYDRIVHSCGISEIDTKQVARAMGTALSILHANDVVHRDVKPENILLAGVEGNSFHRIKLTDFGFAMHGKPHGRQCTLLYASPEVIESIYRYYKMSDTQPIYYSSKCDCWSLGVVLFLCLSGTLPFRGRADNVLTPDLRHAVLNGCAKRMTSSTWDRISTPAKDVITRLLDLNPETRMSASELLQHPWLQDDGIA